MRLNSDVGQALASLKGRRISHVFLVGCGGSLSIMVAGKYFLDRHSSTLASDVYNADEFVTRDPRKLGSDALVILCSQTGATKETVRAAQHARKRGALTIGMTMDTASALARTVDYAVRYQSSYSTGIPIDSAYGSYGVLYMLLAATLDHLENTEFCPALLASLTSLQPAIERAHLRYARLFDTFASRFAHEGAIYTLASGASYGAAYSFAICVLMEMQWYDSQAIHANEFFHGPFEVVDKDSNFIVMIGLDETRPLAERARDFLVRFGSPDKILLLDAAELDLSGIDERFKAYLAPLVFFDVLWRFAYKLADKRQHPMLVGRRYMKKLSSY